MANFIQPYPDSQTQAKLLILQRKNPNLAATISGVLGSDSSNADTALDANARANLFALFSQEIYGGGGPTAE